VRCEAKIVAAIIEAIAVSMVNQKSRRRFNNLPVHRKDSGPVIGAVSQANGIDTRAILLDAPMEIIEPVEVGRVNDGEFVLAEINFAKGITVTEQAKDEQWTGEKKVKPDWNTNC
jgi:hypothetical protein